MDKIDNESYNNNLLLNEMDDKYTETVFNDNISHFICRLSYCRNDELKLWFTKYEEILFRSRARKIDKTKLIRRYNIKV